MGDKQNRPFQLSCNGLLKIDFQGSRITKALSKSACPFCLRLRRLPVDALLITPSFLLVFLPVIVVIPDQLTSTFSTYIVERPTSARMYVVVPDYVSRRANLFGVTDPERAEWKAGASMPVPRK